jgi:hypothetical protein
MREVGTALRKQLEQVGCTQKDFAARWHTLASSRGLAPHIHTVVSELSRLLAGQERGFRFFFHSPHTEITAETFGWTVEELLSNVGIIARDRDAACSATGAP